MKIKPFKYRIRREARNDYSPSGISRTGSREVLSGIVQGKKASDIEERMARAFDRLETPYEFRARISSLAAGDRRLTKELLNLPGEIEIDYLVFSGQVTPVMVDGEISHFMTQAQKLEDEENTASVNEFGAALGWHEVVRVPFTEIETQEGAELVARKIVGGLYL
jgi:hypothetical protein